MQKFIFLTISFLISFKILGFEENLHINSGKASLLDKDLIEPKGIIGKKKYGNWRFHKETFKIDMSSYLFRQNNGVKVIERNDAGAFRSYNNFFIFDGLKQVTPPEYDKSVLLVVIKCDGIALFKTRSYSRKISATEEMRLKVTKEGGVRFYFQIITYADSGICNLTLGDKGFYKIIFKPSRSISWDNTLYFCDFYQTTGQSDLRKFFLTQKYYSYTCPLFSKKIHHLADEVEAFQLKVESLLGRRLPKEFFDKTDPYLDIDFSRAPNLEAIFISYLVFRNDFYGTILRRLLEYHAKKGTLIKIMVSKVISLDKDIKVLNEFSEKYSNVSVLFYKYYSPYNSIKEKFDQLHRTLHVKMFIVWPKDIIDRHPIAIIGGRNIHDGFLFLNKTDLSKYPDLVQYGEDENFVHWTDMEILLTEKQVIDILTSHFFTIFNYSRYTYSTGQIIVPLVNKSELPANYFDRDKTYIRHLASSPYADGYSLEKFYREMILSAKKSIKIVTPYFNLTNTLIDAFSKASEKGVNIEVITRIELEGDTADIILSDVNKNTVNKFKDIMEIYEYTKVKDILHSKIVIIDGELVVIGAVNFNKRSFFHDVENTLVIWSPSFYKDTDAIFKNYKRHSRRITKKLKTIWWKQVIIKIFDDIL